MAYFEIVFMQSDNLEVFRYLLCGINWVLFKPSYWHEMLCMSLKEISKDM